ncbi:hypothetical protein [Cohnella panacarvi]|uniref:hypothetical protein n=1 Tax=Cohnella panacarvi TaxID=400776 RepID=UPI00047D6461|nr:hypothetical protein [Cohnella panacarvi]
MIVSVILFAASAAALLWLYFYMKKRELRGTVVGELPIHDELYRFLEYADDGYILAHETDQISFFSPYASPAVCHAVMDRIHHSPAKMFGTRSLRIRTWRVCKAGDGYYLVRKNITHRTVQAKQGLRIALGDDMEEVWKVSVRPDGYRVEDVN